MRRRGLAMCALAALVVPALGAVRGVRAAATEVVVEYQAYEGCPDRSAFVGAIAARAPDVTILSAKGGARVLRVRIVAVGGAGVSSVTGTPPKKSRGTVDAVDPSGAVTNVRALVGERCEDVAQALAIIVALSIAPDGAGSSTAGASASNATNATNATSATPPPPSGSGAPAPGPHEEPTSSERWSLAAIVADRLRLGATPHPANGPELGLELAPPGEPLRLRLGVDVAFDPAFGAASDARFRLVVAHAGACVPSSGDARAVRFAGCAGVEAGSLRGEGVSIAHPSAVDTAWLALALGGSMRVPFGSTFALDLEAGGALPLLHPRFVFDAPRTVVHETPKFTGFLALSLAVRFL